AAPLERIEREVDLHAAPPDDRAGRETRVLGRAEDDTSADRQQVERLPHRRCGRLLGPLLVGASEPARGQESGVLGRTQIRLAHAGHALGEVRLLGLLLLDRLAHDATFSAAALTRSITSADVSCASTFSITGTPSRSARPMTNVCSRRISAKWSR